MGRQIPVAMTRADEREFIEFLKSTADIAIIESFAPSCGDLWVPGFNDDVLGHIAYSIWNREFPWTPTYGQAKGGNRYVADIFNAPVIEFSRTIWERGDFGRIYWSKYFAASDGLDYDVDAFEKWVDRIWRWVRKNGEKLRRPELQNPYFLPDAARKWKERRGM